MASAAVAVDEGRRDLVALGWIINKKDDLIWFSLTGGRCTP